MKKLLALALLGSLALGLTACHDDEPGPPATTNDERYVACIEAGGSYQYNASLPYWSCTMPGVPQPE